MRTRRGNGAGGGWLLGGLIVLVLSTLPFLPALTGTPVWDDFDILRGPAIGLHKGLAGAFTEPFNFGYYRPLVSLSFQIDHALFGASPFFFHQTNILIHLATVLLATAIAWQFLANRWLALLAGALFGTQPMQTSAVSWIGGRTDSLCALFLAGYLLTLVLGLRSGSIRWVWLLSSGSLLLAALLCKEQSAAAILVVPLAYWLYVPEGKRSFRAALLVAAPFVAACFAFAILWLSAGQMHLAAEPHSTLEQLALGGRGLWHYTLLLLAPTPSVLHTFTFENSRDAGWWPVAIGFVSLASAAYVTYLAWRRRSPLAILGAFVLLCVLPVSNLIPVPSLSVGPYRVAIAGTALAVLLAWLVGAVWRHSRPTAVALGVAMVGFSFGLTAWASGQWRSEERFFNTVAEFDPAFYVARVNIAATYDISDEAAITHVGLFLDWLFRTPDWRKPGVAVRLWERDPSVERRIKDNAGTKVPTRSFVANAFLNLGLSQSRAERLVEGRHSLETAVAFDPMNANAHCGLGEVYASLAMSDEAERHFKRALILEEWNVPAMLEYASLLRSQGRFAEAEEHLRSAVKWLPWHGLPSLRLAQVLDDQGKTKEAREVLTQAVERGALARDSAEDFAARLEGS